MGVKVLVGILLGTLLVVVPAPSASAISECNVATSAAGAMTGSGCIFAKFTLDISNAPGRVSGTVNGTRVELSGYGSGVSGQYGARRVSLTNGVVSPHATGKVGRKTLTMGEGLISGVTCFTGKNWLATLVAVKTDLLGRLTVSDSPNGALCLALVVAAGYLDEA